MPTPHADDSTTVDLAADFHGHRQVVGEVAPVIVAGVVDDIGAFAQISCGNGPCWSLAGRVIEVIAIRPGVRIRRPLLIDEAAA